MVKDTVGKILAADDANLQKALCTLLVFLDLIRVCPRKSAAAYSASCSWRLVSCYEAFDASRIIKSKVPGAVFRKRVLRLRETAMLIVGFWPVNLKPPSSRRL